VVPYSHGRLVRWHRLHPGRPLSQRRFCFWQALQAWSLREAIGDAEGGRDQLHAWHGDTVRDGTL
jgi:hypothetical protein